ncbi:PH domain-containing protein [Patescibacteria group bacterium]|nr:PH domain-containing protein [Patescibacteria group bacterium]
MFRDFVSQNLKDGEKVVAVIRKHWAGFLKPIIITFLILVVPFFFVIFFFSRWWTMLIFFVWISVGLGYGLFQWFTWYFDSFVVTNKRVINIDQKRIFAKSVSEANLENIQNITYEINGLMASIFGYGTIKIETAGSETSINVSGISHPADLQELISTRQSKMKKTVSADDIVNLIQKSKKNEEKK